MATHEVNVLVVQDRLSRSTKIQERRFYDDSGEAHKFIMKHVGGLTEDQYRKLDKNLQSKFEQRIIQGRADQEASKLWLFKKPVWDWHVVFTETETQVIKNAA